MVYLDANVVIRSVEGVFPINTAINARLAPLRGTPGSLLTSRLTRLECRVLPLRTGDGALLAVYETFFTGPEVALIDVTPAVIDKATELRANLRFKAVDSLHLATAILAGASAFLTGDKALARCTEIPVEVL